MKKISHIVRRFTPHDWGGIEETVLNLSKKLIEKGIESEIYCTDALSTPGDDTIGGVHVHRYPSLIPTFGLNKEMYNKLQRKGANSLSFPMLFSLLKEQNISLIHTHVQHRLGGIARTAALLKKIPYVVTLHGGELTLSEDQAQLMRKGTEGLWEWGKVFGWMLGARRTVSDAHAIICVGKDEYALMQKKYPDKAVYYVPNGIDVQKFTNHDPSLFRNAIGLTQNEPYLLCVSRIDQQKNQRLLIDAFSRLNEKYHLVMIGPVTVPSYLAELEETIKRYRIEDRVHLVHGYPPEDPRLHSAYSGASLFVLPSTMEPFGIVILEAWASKIPVVASRVGGISGFTEHEKNALLFQSGNCDELTERIEQALNDELLRKALVENGWNEVHKYTWEKVSEKYMNIYDEALCRCG